MLSSGQALVPQSLRRWMPVAVIGLVAVTAGIALPRALLSAPEAVKAAPSADGPGKGALAYTPPTLPEMPDPRSMLTRLGLATAGVLALCCGTIWFGRRWLGGATPPAGGTSQLRLVETLPLGNRCSLHLIQVGHRQVLVGADPSGLRTVVPLLESFEQALTAAPGLDPAMNDPEGSLALSEKNHGRYSEAR